ncbi:ferredoxin-NAD(P)+ reductase (naphthalene dioxygenase ferredoxin-specific) [Acidovorax soli]|uniref:Ferredoxin-NAD(P)+ reductase (Naphthalene dioxygenase ferredoxin-specific) n=1 Tax=Acidovorax soli TaxID=592050 RepID=A0A7X0PDA9_9BURK|nr:2Fe-2S iron-sulfur cluster-binding protein [Acidovorax soli]MBB6559810.1 ferredoxin-NAD(P)+ reductase (naphthalene dioxygenase ferredoxin-specific) [Acidovorax soli]
MEIHVRPLGRTLHVAPGVNLLEALRANDVPVSYSCMAGRCGTCRCKVVQGTVLDAGRELQRPPAVGADEDGHVLACQTFVTEPCTVEIVEPDEVVVHTARTLKATVLAIEDATHDIKRLRLQPAKPLDFSPGQYAQLQFTPAHARPYSMAGLAGDGALEFHVRLVPEGRVTGYIAQDLKVGDAVRVSGPLGSAYLRRRHDGPMLCVAGGTGLAPILSIVRGALAAGMHNPVHLYFGVRSERDVYGLDWLAALQRAHPALTVHTVLASGRALGCRSGLVTEAIAADWPRLAGFRAYLCGAPPMVEATALLVRRLGIPTAHIYADAFYASGT